MSWEVHAGAGFDPRSLTEDRSLPRRWRALWAAEPGRPAMRFPGEPAWVSAAELEDRTARRARTLAGLGVGPGDRVLLCASSPAPVVEWNVGALRLGAVVVPANPAYRERELTHIVTDADPAVAVVEADDHAGWIGDRVPMIRTAAPPDVSADVVLDAADLDDPALLPYTSGTTGTPKGALLTHGNLLSSVAAVRRAWRWTPDDRLVHSLPLFHMHGLGLGIYGTLAAGASAVLLPGFDTAAVTAAVDDHGATLFFGVPTMYARLVEADGVERFRRLRMCASGSAPLAPELFQRIEQRSGHRPIERYGMTETVMNVSNPYEGERRPGSVGLPLPGVDVRLAEHGEIELRGPNVFPGYWGRPDATAEAFTADGWFRTGDLGERDADGYLRIVGRAKELIITGGYNVYPREIEDALLELAGVREVAVVGRPSPEWGEIVTAFVVRDGARPDVDDIAAFCADRLAGYKRPRQVEFVDTLPRNALGKVLRHELR